MKDVRAGDLVFRCENAIEEWRANGLFTKEPGTIAWLREELKPGDVFYDIGANIGCYSLFAASLGATVYAFEPHIGTAMSLMRNVVANNLGDRIMVATCAVGETAGFGSFNYATKIAGTSGSQLNRLVGENGKEFTPTAVEMKSTVTVDDTAGDDLPFPDLVKVDVDGNEVGIVRSMKRVCMVGRVRSFQIEIHPNDAAEIIGIMRLHKYPNHTRYDTAAGAKRIAEGADPATVTHNLIFRRA